MHDDATRRLRKLLDDAGIPWEDASDDSGSMRIMSTMWIVGDCGASAIEIDWNGEKRHYGGEGMVELAVVGINGRFKAEPFGVSPEDAIATAERIANGSKR